MTSNDLVALAIAGTAIAGAYFYVKSKTDEPAKRAADEKRKSGGGGKAASIPDKERYQWGPVGVLCQDTVTGKTVSKARCHAVHTLEGYLTR